MRRQLLAAVGNIQSPESLGVLQKSLARTTYSVQKDIALMLANSQEGIGYLLKSVHTLDVSPRLLLDRQVSERLKSSMSKGRSTYSRGRRSTPSYSVRRRGWIPSLTTSASRSRAALIRTTRRVSDFGTNGINSPTSQPRRRRRLGSVIPTQN